MKIEDYKVGEIGYLIFRDKIREIILEPLDMWNRICIPIHENNIWGEFQYINIGNLFYIKKEAQLNLIQNKIKVWKDKEDTYKRRISHSQLCQQYSAAYIQKLQELIENDNFDILEFKNIEKIIEQSLENDNFDINIFNKIEI